MECPGDMTLKEMRKYEFVFRAEGQRQMYFIDNHCRLSASRALTSVFSAAKPPKRAENIFTRNFLWFHAVLTFKFQRSFAERKRSLWYHKFQVGF